MSVVRIPRPEEDAFPWPRVAVVTVLGAMLGLGIAFWGMERDRTATEIEDDAPATEPTITTAPEAEAPPSAPEPTPEREPTVEPEATPEPETTREPEPTPEPTPEPEAEAALEPTPSSPSGPVTLRTGRVAYLRCDGVPQRPGPFPCPRDEPLEASVWQALRAVERCDRAPGPGAADIVVDFDGSEPTIRGRDTFPSDTVRTDATALLACAGDSLTNVRSSLSPRRLVVSFRLTLEARAR